MKITMYELLGLIKDGKAPKEIKYENFVYSWVRKYKTYTRYDIPGKDLYITTNNLNDEVEVIEENKKIEKLYPIYGSRLIDLGDKDQINNNKSITYLILILNKMSKKIDELTDEINKMKEGK